MNPTTKTQPTDKAREAVNQATDKAKEAGSHLGEAAQAVGQAVGQKAEEATAAVGGGIQNLAEKVRRQGPDQGVLGQATQSVAHTLDEAGHYIEDKKLSGMVEDMNGLIKRNPIPAVAVALGVGFLLGRVLRS